jgi:hypothetical protein
MCRQSLTHRDAAYIAKEAAYCNRKDTRISDALPEDLVVQERGIGGDGTTTIQGGYRP